MTPIDPSLLEYLFEKTPIEQWDNVSQQYLTEGLANPETKNSYTMYLKSKPNREEARLVKEIMLNSLKQTSLPEVNPLH